MRIFIFLNDYFRFTSLFFNILFFRFLCLFFDSISSPIFYPSTFLKKQNRKLKPKIKKVKKQKNKKTINNSNIKLIRCKNKKQNKTFKNKTQKNKITILQKQKLGC